MVAVAYGSRRTLANPLMGVLVPIGVLTWTGTDKRIEAWVVERMPDWLLDLTTRL